MTQKCLQCQEHSKHTAKRIFLLSYQISCQCISFVFQRRVKAAAVAGQLWECRRHRWVSQQILVWVYETKIEKSALTAEASMKTDLYMCSRKTLRHHAPSDWKSIQKTFQSPKSMTDIEEEPGVTAWPLFVDIIFQSYWVILFVHFCFSLLHVGFSFLSFYLICMLPEMCLLVVLLLPPRQRTLLNLQLSLTFLVKKRPNVKYN